jgi:hypothetical protein
MPGVRCKIIIDGGRFAASMNYSTRMAQAATTMIDEAVGRGVLKGDDPKVTQINDKLCYWAEKVEAWNVELFKLASEIAAQPSAKEK